MRSYRCQSLALYDMPPPSSPACSAGHGEVSIARELTCFYDGWAFSTVSVAYTLHDDYHRYRAPTLVTPKEFAYKTFVSAGESPYTMPLRHCRELRYEFQRAMPGAYCNEHYSANARQAVSHISRRHRPRGRFSRF